MSDLSIRLAAFEWLDGQTTKYGEVLPRALLAEGFKWQQERIPLVGPQGIFKPQVCELPLSITTSPNSPYSDFFSNDDLLHYRYRGTDPLHRDNRALRTIMNSRLPLIYFYGVAEGRYLPVWPVFIVSDNPTGLTFSVAVDTAKFERANQDMTYRVAEDDSQCRRAYITAQTKVRLHQRSFREKVLTAYHEQCAFCRLKHQELLDAAHIIPDSDPSGEPVISNGIALCKLHHAAFDSHFLGLTPRYVIEVRQDILHEPDGPMHLYGLKALQGQKVNLPKRQHDWPDVSFLERRYSEFRSRDVGGEVR